MNNKTKNIIKLKINKKYFIKSPYFLLYKLLKSSFCLSLINLHSLIFLGYNATSHTFLVRFHPKGLCSIFFQGFLFHTQHFIKFFLVVLCCQDFIIRVCLSYGLVSVLYSNLYFSNITIKIVKRCYKKMSFFSCCCTKYITKQF